MGGQRSGREEVCVNLKTCACAVTRRTEVCSIDVGKIWQYLNREKRTGEEKTRELGGLAFLKYPTLT